MTVNPCRTTQIDGAWKCSIGTNLQIAEQLHGGGAHLLGSGLRFEDTGLLGEGVDALARLGRGAVLDDETSNARDDELAALLELTEADGADGLHDAAALLAAEARLRTEIVEELTLGQVGSLGLDAGEGLDLLHLGGGDLLGLLDLLRLGRNLLALGLLDRLLAASLLDLLGHLLLNLLHHGCE